MDENTHEQVPENMFESGNVPETQEAEVEPLNDQEVQEPTGEPEFIEVEGTQIPVDEIDNLKSYTHFQSKYDHERIETSKEREARIRAEERVRLLEEQLQSPKTVQEPQAPQEPVYPEEPADLDMADFYDSTTVSGQWYKKKLAYDRDKAAFDAHWRGNIEKERQQTLQERQAEEQFLKIKNEKIAEFQKVPNTTLQEAMAAFDLINSEEVLKPENVIGYYRFINSKNPKKTIKQPGRVAPAASVPSVHEDQVDESKTFMQSFDPGRDSIFTAK